VIGPLAVYCNWTCEELQGSCTEGLTLTAPVPLTGPAFTVPCPATLETTPDFEAFTLPATCVLLTDKEGVEAIDALVEAAAVPATAALALVPAPEAFPVTLPAVVIAGLVPRLADCCAVPCTEEVAVPVVAAPATADVEVEVCTGLIRVPVVEVVDETEESAVLWIREPFAEPLTPPMPPKPAAPPPAPPPKAPPRWPPRP
jgi:hypothetical protein